MLRAAVTVLGIAALATAVVLIVGLRDGRRSPRPPAPEGAGFGEGLVTTLGRTSALVAAATTSGILVLGLGGRFMMRLLAATSSDDAQGRLTDAEEVVGRVTVGGTVFLVLGVGIFGGLFGLAVFTILRRWLPDRSLLAGLAASGVGAGLLARPSGLVDPDNLDFELLAPTWLAVVLCIGLLVVFGLLLGALADAWVARWPRPGWSASGVAAVLPLALLGPAPVLLLALLAGVALWSGVGGHLSPGTGVDRLGRVVVLGLAVLGGAWTLAGAAQILAA